MTVPRPSENWLRDREPGERRRHSALPVIMINPAKPKVALTPAKKLKEPITRELAEYHRYSALTTMYFSNERWMLENVIADMERGGIDYQLVGRADEFGNHLVEVWRKGIVRVKDQDWRVRNGEVA